LQAEHFAQKDLLLRRSGRLRRNHGGLCLGFVGDEQINDLQNADSVNYEQNHIPNFLSGAGSAPQGQTFPNQRPGNYQKKPGIIE